MNFHNSSEDVKNLVLETNKKQRLGLLLLIPSLVLSLVAAPLFPLISILKTIPFFERHQRGMKPG
jgi:hypothetical protein